MLPSSGVHCHAFDIYIRWETSFSLFSPAGAAIGRQCGRAGVTSTRGGTVSRRSSKSSWGSEGGR